ncbi:AAA family ATPase, partial [Oribacterium sp. WCC10]|uniref:AAA family ATPase n=1 Tax=Oribacterium sp. WCC10 TaxID=1855343 RepID=UPI0008DF7757
MGIYLNPGNDGFSRIEKGEYVDKTGLIGNINRCIDTSKNLICISRPRRFGKSYAAQMLCAYYDKTCDSHGLFDKYEIASDESYEKYIGRYDVIYWDMTGVKPYTDKYKQLVPFLADSLLNELKDQYPDVTISSDLPSTLANAAEEIGGKFVIMIDEWDAPIRENPEVQKEYLEFLRSLFKNSGTTSKIFAAAYMTGILPIKKDGSQSAISDFEEFTVVKPRQYGQYVGFTEQEVRHLCDVHGTDFKLMKRWYDGYRFKGVGSVYNPNSVMKAIAYDDFDSYWTETSAAEGLMSYISKPYNGMAKTI